MRWEAGGCERQGIKTSFELGSLSFVRYWNLGGAIKAEQKRKEAKYSVHFILGVLCASWRLGGFGSNGK
jgi:hypothetical protein